MKKVFSIMMVVILIAALAIGCTSSPVTNQNANSNSNTTNDSSNAGSASANPTTSEKKFKWVAQSPWPAGTVLHWSAERTAKDIYELSGGRLEIEMHPAGAIVQAFDMLDAVSTGTLDAIQSWDGYWMGQIPSAAFFAAMPMGMRAQEYQTWLLEGEGAGLWQEIYKGKYNIHLIPAGSITPEVLFYANKPVRKLEDFKGMKVRGVGFWGAIQAQLGASVVAIPGGEVYQALERGVVDGAEFSAPSVNYDLGFHEVTKYMIVPGIHQPATLHSFMINEERWNELPDDLKKIVEVANENMWGRLWAKSAAADMEAMQKYLDLQKQGKLEIISFPKEEQLKMKELAEQYYDDLGAKDPMAKKIIESQRKFLEKYRAWSDLMVPQY
jgi:TRAP-type mannitol/chloroaromatic compound transport system substrate-binding protein